MKLPLRIGPWSTIRGYATRRPERPPSKPKDPLIAPSATHYQVGPNLTFVHRPPPTAPTPFSLSIAPASPLLLPPTQVTSSLSEEASVSSTLPPPLWKERKQPEKRLTPEQVEEIKRLRAEDPVTWTKSRLAAQFGCLPCYISMIAPLKKSANREMLARREEVHEANRSRWGERKATAMAIREKRKSLW
ncbi:mitochondrial ribosomal protein subunit L20-domain-containing protein [Hysterangium stoloniferum]|nr:mitochondrial ribosomal protein subunit L20-domain-containing protein [Hysterangium stoloniferum]